MSLGLGLGLGLAGAPIGAGPGNVPPGVLAFVNSRAWGGVFTAATALNEFNEPAAVGERINLWVDQSNHLIDLDPQTTGGESTYAVTQSGVLVGTPSTLTKNGYSFHGKGPFFSQAGLDDLFESELGLDGTIVFFYVNQTGARCYNLRPSRTDGDFSQGLFPGVDAAIWGWAWGTVTDEQADTIKAELWAGSGFAAKKDMTFFHTDEFRISATAYDVDPEDIGTVVGIDDATTGLSDLSPPWTHNTYMSSIEPYSNYDAFGAGNFYAETPADLTALGVVYYDQSSFTVRSDLADDFPALEHVELSYVDGPLDVSNLSEDISTFTVRGNISDYNEGVRTVGGPAPDFSTAPFAESLGCLDITWTALHGDVDVSGCESLEVLRLQQNALLNSVDASGCASLYYFYVFGDTEITSVNVSGTALGGSGYLYVATSNYNRGITDFAAAGLTGGYADNMIQVVADHSNYIETLDLSDNTFDNVAFDYTLVSLESIKLNNTVGLADVRITSNGDLGYVGLENAQMGEDLYITAEESEDLTVNLAGCTATNIYVYSPGLSSFPFEDVPDAENVIISAGPSFTSADISANEELLGLQIADTAMPAFSTTGAIALTELNIDDDTLETLTLVPSAILGSLTLYADALQTINGLSGVPGLNWVHLYLGAMLSAAKDQIVIDIEAFGTSGGTLAITSSTAWVPGAPALAAKAALEGRGWTVTLSAP